MNPRRLAYATFAVLVVAVLMTARGIETRVVRARAQFERPELRETLPARFHQGPPPCRRYLVAANIPTTQTASTARALVRAGLVRWMPEVLALTWSWSAQDEARHHALTPDEEYVEWVLESLSPVDRFWLGTLGQDRIREWTRSSTATEALIAQRALDAEARMPAHLRAQLHTLWTSNPGPLVRPAEVGLIEAVAREAQASAP